MSSPLKVWDKLDTKGVEGQGYIRLRLLSVTACPTYAARRLVDGLESLLLEVSTISIPGESRLPRTRGFEVRAEVLKPGRRGQTRLLLSLSEERYRDVFTALATDIVARLEASLDEEAAVRIFLERLARWQAFLRKHNPSGLALEARRGLFGELLILRENLSPYLGSTASVAAWKGYAGKPHDFQCQGGHLEVKTTAANTPHAFHVSNIKQLDPDGVPALFLAVVIIEEVEHGGETLPVVVDSIRKLLSAVDIEVFEDGLIDVGYLESQRGLYSTPSYKRRRVRFFQVREGFPSLREQQLPEGVEEVGYQVAIAACSGFEVTEQEVLSALVAAE